MSIEYIKNEEGWSKRASRNAKRAMKEWGEAKLRTAYTLLRPSNWVGSEEDYQQWKKEIMEVDDPDPVLGDWI